VAGQALVGASALAGPALVGAATAESRRQTLIRVAGAATRQTLVRVVSFTHIQPA
jgi:sarcosine oxidase gamma subunit